MEEGKTRCPELCFTLALTSSGLPPECYTAHSLCIRVATAESTVPVSMLRSMGWWSSSAKEYYLRLKAQAIFNSQKLKCTLWSACSYHDGLTALLLFTNSLYMLPRAPNVFVFNWTNCIVIFMWLSFVLSCSACSFCYLCCCFAVGTWKGRKARSSWL